ncbi:MAG: amylo-alpha-1,6-glucosidase, partial [Chloroflexales bacterium]|nr:amylo-alpha-1,6-glucosidase [Chloroflexales bacterium]
ASYRLEQRGASCAATLVYHITLKAGERREWHFALAAESERGADAARHTCAALVKDGGALFAQQEQTYGRYALHAEADDAGLTRDVDLAQANLRLLHADYPALGAYFLAGLPEYPQLFGCDTTYSVPGALAAGFIDVTRNAMLRLAAVAQDACARFPHELTTNGRVFHPGNIQETPQFVIACWDFVRWTGDLAFGRELLPLCREALDEFIAMVSWPDGMYPFGDGMVERLGMGGRKLDSVCYHYAALLALADLCDALDDDGAAYRARAATLKARFTVDWWLEDQGLYADSMDTDGALHFDGHWTVALPLQLGLAEGVRAARMWDRIEREWVNEWGLIHTREAEPLVWTLPTGLLALAAFEHGRAALGLKLVENIALTARVGTLGTFKELIPEGMCFVQLWSAGLYLQGVVEGLFGVRPLAHQHRVELRPCLPPGRARWALDGLCVGAHTLNLSAEGDTLYVEHVSGPQSLVVAYGGSEGTVEVGARQQIARAHFGRQNRG